MAKGFTGDIGALGNLAENLRRLTEVPSRAARAACEDIKAAIEKQFDEGKDPYGRPWKPLARSTIARGRTPPPLTDTGDMRDSIEVKPMAGAGISITIGVDYASYHQTGTSRMPARKILPEGNDMPPEWEEAIGRAMLEAFERTGKGS